MQVADFRAASGLMRLTLEQQADQEDWKDFSNQVLAKLTPERAPLIERIKLTVNEMFTYQRRMFVTGLAAAACATLIAVPLAVKLASSQAGYGNERIEVTTVRVEQGSRFAPVVMETESGDAIIWMVDSPEKKKDEKKKTGEESEETGSDPEPTLTPKKAGEL